jgi:hypothetical protein
MKVTINIDCTPVEARNFFGLPDLQPMQERILGEIEQRMKAGLGSMDPAEIFKTWVPASMSGVDQMGQLQNAFWQQLAAMAGGQTKK